MVKTTRLRSAVGGGGVLARQAAATNAVRPSSSRTIANLARRSSWLASACSASYQGSRGERGRSHVHGATSTLSGTRVATATTQEALTHGSWKRHDRRHRRRDGRCRWWTRKHGRRGHHDGQRGWSNSAQPWWQSRGRRSERRSWQQPRRLVERRHTQFRQHRPRRLAQVERWFAKVEWWRIAPIVARW